MKKQITRIVFLLAMVVFVFPVAASADTSGMEIWFESGTTKIRQNVIPKNQPTWEIKSAKNEFEPFQLAIKKSGSDATNIDVTISDFVGQRGTIPSSNITIFKEHYLNITNLSSIEGQLGEWPDALLPKVDAYYHETRTTFPFAVPAGRVQPVWFDVFVPATTAAGQYAATVTVTEQGTSVFTGTVTLTVWDFALPATSSLTSNFKNTIGLWAGFSGAAWVSPNLMQDQMRWFLRAGLRHRITSSPYNISRGTYDAVNKTYPNFEHARYDYSINGYLDGTSGDVEYGASRLTSTLQDLGVIYKETVSGNGPNNPPYSTYCTNPAITEPPQEYKERLTALVSAYAANLTPAQKENIYFLIIDEAGGGEVGCGAANATLDYNSLKWGADLVHSYGMKTRATNRIKSELLNTNVVPPRNDYIDLWSTAWPVLVGRHWDGTFIDRTGDYAGELARGIPLWWYHGCMDTSCGSTGGSGFNGYINYLVEYPAMRARISPWMNFKYGIQGEELWSVTAGFSKSTGFSGDPYHSLWSSNYATNGDGVLFYPGVVNTAAVGLPAADGRGAHTPSIGGTHDIPIESIRLKMIREGYEDYEYLKKLKDLGSNDWAQSKVATLVTNTYTWNSNEGDMYAVREALATKIGELMGSADVIPPSIPTGLSVQ